jgi:hypothetical protein
METANGDSDWRMWMENVNRDSEWRQWTQHMYKHTSCWTQHDMSTTPHAVGPNTTCCVVDVHARTNIHTDYNMVFDPARCLVVDMHVISLRDTMRHRTTLIFWKSVCVCLTKHIPSEVVRTATYRALKVVISLRGNMRHRTTLIFWKSVCVCLTKHILSEVVRTATYRALQVVISLRGNMRHRTTLIFWKSVCVCLTKHILSEVVRTATYHASKFTL